MRFWITLFVLALAGCTSTPPRGMSPRAIERLDDGWRFVRADAAAAAEPSFDDSAWQTVTLPHDWSIAGPFAATNPTGGAGAFLPSGVAWYRRTFTVPPTSAGRRVYVELDGVMENSDVWINGQLLGHRPNGYVSLRYELTPHLKFGANERNVLAVRADTSRQPASRWYSGAGIYRHVRLITTDRIFLEPDSVFVTTPPPAAGGGSRVIAAKARVQNQSAQAATVSLHLAVIDPHGQEVAATDTAPQAVGAGGAGDFAAQLSVASAQLWDIAQPNLYRLRVDLREAETVHDSERVTFGIRDAVFDSQRGFVLNGHPLKLYGVCLHHDGGAFGAAVPLAVWEQRLATLRTLGVNAIRTAHNPPDPGFLDLCDRLGFLVMDELFDCWTVGKNPYDYHLAFNEWSKIDVRDTVRRDRNHPSIVVYSAGNEIHDTPQEEFAKGILRGLVDTFHENDPSRPVTQALFRPNVSHDYTNGLADLLDVVGTNYRDGELIAAWKAKPTRKILGTEQRHDRETWLALRDTPAHAGQFLWTGVDYLGEARAWPAVASSFGLIDRAGYVKPVGRERQSWWTAQPMIALLRRIAPNEVSNYDPGYEPDSTANRRLQRLFPDWSPHNDQPHEETVEVYTNCESAELFLNGKSRGVQKANANAAPLNWKVPYTAGILRVVGRNGGSDVATDELRTAGTAAKLLLTADRDEVSSDWEDVVRLSVTIADSNGTPVPTATSLITFSVAGPGQIVAVDNGDISSSEPFQATERHAYQGRAFVFVRGAGKAGTFVVKATAANVQAAETKLTVVPSSR